MEVLAAMTSLTFLRLSRADCCCVPAALSAVPSLKVLALAFNKGFQLGRKDVAVVAQLPLLDTFKISTRKSGKGLRSNSIYALLELRQRLPQLDIVLEESEGSADGSSEKGSEVWSGGRLTDYV